MRLVRVLIAEDNEDHLFLARVALQAVQGVQIEVVAVQDGQEALDYLHGRGQYDGRELPHLILLDLSMPRKDGLTVLKELRADEMLQSLPVVVLTSSDRPEDVNAAYALGANSYVNKAKGLSNLADYWTQTANLPDPAVRR
ncbi:two-component response regulator [Euzebya pacifica]|uniref:Two-component response regulator n=1 Tax=Euzebya pacifica TaxID=1608957 RepID=A0A346Y2B8_9ACTN|nr:response regulator [Euzebya pacifica]AXV08615.1 two-component response regulator [Euzebya pacifica]